MNSQYIFCTTCIFLICKYLVKTLTEVKSTTQHDRGLFTLILGYEFFFLLKTVTVKCRTAIKALFQYQCSRICFYSNFPRESNDSKLTFPDQRIKNSSLFVNFGFFFWWITLFGIRETKIFHRNSNFPTSKFSKYNF